MKIATKRKTCRICGNTKLIPCIDLGDQYLSSVFPKSLSYRKEAIKYPLSMVLCEKNKNTCGLLQLEYNIDLDDMYKFYPYLSSTNSSMKVILKDIVDDSLKRIKLSDNDTILDIGGNDGTLLSYFNERKLNLLAIDPAQNVKQIFKSKKYNYINNYFSEKVYHNNTKEGAKIIFSIAMFYHLSDPIKFSNDVKNCLDDDGIWIIQMAYLPSMLSTNMYDNIVHEHAGYYTLHNMKWIMDKVGLEIFDAKLNNVYGGSFRVFIKKKENKKNSISKNVSKILNKEKKIGVEKAQTYKDFMQRVEKTKNDLIKLIGKIKQEGKNIWAYGASTKGNTILQYCGINSKNIVAAADSNPFKIGKYIIGSDIPIKSETDLRKAKPDYLLALPYSFTKTFVEREKTLVKKGTKFIVPLPEVKILP